MASRVPARFVLCLGCLLAYLGAINGADRSPVDMSDAAIVFLSTLTPEQRQTVSFAFDNIKERERFGYAETEDHERAGLSLENMTGRQRGAVHELLKAGLSEKGYMTADAIMQLESVLNLIENPPGVPPRPRALERNPLKYFVWIFGTPGTRSTWGWKLEGHHLSLNFTIVNGTMVSTAPHFFGADPAEVRDGPNQRQRLLGYEEDPARELVMMLDPSQRAKAVISATAPNEILTRNDSAVRPLAPTGIAAAELQPRQRDALMRVVDAYTSAMAPDLAADRMAALTKAGLDTITFAWAGELERGKRHYYRVQGPTFLIEFDHTQDNGHVHSVWRDFNGDWGRDLLREHLATSPR
jgi:hypothetical protein